MATTPIGAVFFSLLLSATTARPEATSTQPPPSEAVELSAGSGTVYGTLLLPPHAATPAPVVLLISGSGPTDRDGNSKILPGPNNSLKLLAEGLAANGIASVRYDKRGVGASEKALTAEADIRFDNYVDDAAALCGRLRKDKRFSGVVIAGHSEGSLIGMVAARRCGANGFVSIAGVGQPAAKTLRAQLAGKLPPELATKNEAVLAALEQGKKPESTPPELAMLYRDSVQPYLISWFKYDPAREIAAITVPILLIQGTTDIQVTVDDAKKLSAANPKAKLVIVDGMNHVMKVVTDPEKQMASYSDPALPLAPSVVPAIVELVHMAVGPAKQSENRATATRGATAR
jgi:pimeloyl-ACP methyl ester carboxylesterase